MSRFEVHTFRASKRGSEPLDCEDALCVDAERGFFAIADGATEAFDSGYWARLLTRAWVRRHEIAPESLPPLATCLAERLKRRWAGKALPWYAAEKAQGGSFAAFLGLAIQLGAGGTEWQAVSVGDSCLFHLRGSEMIMAVPLASPVDFGNSPALLASRPASPEDQAIVAYRGEIERGDRILMLTDSAACWFLRKQAVDPRLAQDFEARLRANDMGGLMAIIEGARSSSQMRNDDVAALLVAV